MAGREYERRPHCSRRVGFIIMDKLLLSSFISVNEFPFPELLSRYSYAWEVLPLIAQFIEDNCSEYEQIGDKVYVGKNVEIEEASKIIGPVFIGSNSKIGHAAYIRPATIIGDNVQIGHASEIKNSIILNNTSIAHLNYVGDSIVGSNVNIAGGVIVANWRFDKKTVSVKVEDTRNDTGLEKFGAVIGDGANIGVNTVLNPGTFLGRRTIVYPLTLVSGLHSEDSVVK